MWTLQPKDFDEWRSMARSLVLSEVSPDEVIWAETEDGLLFEPELPNYGSAQFSVPKQFVPLAQKAALFRAAVKWKTLYRVLWRLKHQDRNLLNRPSDSDVRRLHDLVGEVRRDCHKMKAFVRFRESGKNSYVAWHQPSHLVVEAVAPFFARRFNTMNWAILTPDRSAYWDQDELRFGPGLPRSAAPDGDELEELWKTYYANIFNPARIKISAMTSEMPKKYWHTMPETALIPELLAKANARVSVMVEHAESDRRSPDNIISAVLGKGGDLDAVASESKACQGCEICHSATQTVFGEGPREAKIMVIGEQPGDKEDRVGRPFVGPAGQLLRRCLKQVGASPKDIYFSNVVKHFRWEQSPNQGKKRLHKRATWRQIDTCKPWVQAEIALVQPQVIILLGATALQALVGREHKIGEARGRCLQSELAPAVLSTVHPSYLLRVKDPQRKEAETERFCQDLEVACSLVSESPRV